MIYPLVRELAVDGIPVTVTCRVLKIARQPYYRWLAQPVTDAEWVQAYRANALFDAHREDLEFGYRFLADEARDAGQPMADRTAWRICSEPTAGGVCSVRRSPTPKARKAGAPAHDDLVAREFTADAANRLAATITTLPEQLRRSLTWDRGKEMSAHAQFKVETGIPVYFADPQSPWQRGTNENTNGLLRQYFPTCMGWAGRLSDRRPVACRRTSGRADSSTSCRRSAGSLWVCRPAGVRSRLDSTEA